jgi:hypothetical protein
MIPLLGLMLTLHVGGAAQATLPDNYKCYKAKEAKRVCAGDLASRCRTDWGCTGVGGPCLLGFESRTVPLGDLFGDVSADVKKPKSMCTPVSTEGESILDPLTHMMRYRITRPTKTERTVLIRDRYGDHVLKTIKVDSLLVPSMTSWVDVPLPPVSGHDHYLCYRAREVKQVCTGDRTTWCKTDEACTDGTCHRGFTARTGVALVDLLESGPVEVKKPTLLCTPVDKQGEGVGDDGYYLVGYLIRGGATPHTGFRVANQFGVAGFSTLTDQLLFVPALNLAPRCGNHLIDASEECDAPDDGACPGLCRANCICAVCGDGIVNQPSEQCDLVDDEACPGQCKPSPAKSAMALTMRCVPGSAGRTASVRSAGTGW